MAEPDSTDDDSLPDLSNLNARGSVEPESKSNDSVLKQIGPYKILQKIAEGGMGAVYMAEQSQPIKRRVALKLIKAGRDSDQIIARFDAERQALAMMDHPSIAKIFDAGTSDDGSPYFVMELVNGIPLTEYCDNNKLSIRERLELFVPVCKAIQHAHTKGIIHRDLKPSNVLVALYDGVPIPKVIDFGLAKATEHQLSLTDKTMFTEFGQVVGTLQYMSPEQAEMNQLDIDTRTDVYSLGVMLYELLTGSTPLDNETMKEQALLKVLELIRERDPQRPSTRLSDSGEAISGVSEQRRIDPSRLQKILKGELDWIVMKSLEKERTRRYETPNDFAQDVLNFLNDETVNARPPSSGYKIKKLIGKNRGLFYALTAVASVLTAGIATSTWFAFLANNRNVELIAANAREIDAKELAQSNEQKARKQSQLALATLTSVIDDIQEGLKGLSGSGEVRKRLLKTSLSKLKQVSNEYLDQASVDHQTIWALFNMGELLMNSGSGQTESDDAFEESATQLALQVFERANQVSAKIAVQSPDDLQAQRDLGVSFIKLGEVQLLLGNTRTALAYYRKSVRIDEKLMAAHKDNTMVQRDLAVSYDRLGNIYVLLSDTQSALASYTSSLKIRLTLAESNDNTAIAQRELSASHSKIGNVKLLLNDTESALESLQQSLKIDRELAAEDKDNVPAQRALSISLNKIGKVFIQLGDVQSALEYFTQSLEIRRTLAEADKDNAQAKRDLSISLNRLGDVQLESGDTQSAQSLYIRSLEISRSLAEADEDNTQLQRDLSISYDRMGDFHREQGEMQLALESYKRGLEICYALAEVDKNNSMAQRDVSVSQNKLGEIYLELGEFQAALDSCTESLKISSALAKADKDNAQAQRDLAVAHNKMGNTLREFGDTQSALNSYKESMKINLALAEANKGNTRALRDVMVSHYKLAKVFEAEERYGEAAESFKKGADVLRAMIKSGMNVEATERELAILEADASDAEMAELVFGDWEKLLQQPPDSLPILLDQRGIGFASREKFTEAVRAASKLVELEDVNNGQLYNAACVFALSAGAIVAKDREELTINQSNQRKKLIAEAMSALKQSVTAGWEDFEHMRSDSDLIVLRELPDFRELSQSNKDE